MKTEQKQTNPETGTKYSRAELKAAFDAVCDRSNWKNPVQGTILPKDEDVTREAVIFFTGSVPKFRARPSGRLLVEAAGYYKTIGI